MRVISLFGRGIVGVAYGSLIIFRRSAMWKLLGQTRSIIDVRSEFFDR